MKHSVNIPTSVSLFLFLLFASLTNAEGTREVAPNGSITINGDFTTDIAALLIGHNEYNNFASGKNNDPNSRLYIHITDPTTECIFLGLSVGHVNATQNPAPPTVNYQYQIKDPNGNTVFGPVEINSGDQNINSWLQAFNGPQGLGSTGGYIEVNISSADLTSQGWNGKGDYYIEFDNLDNVDNEFLIDFWDISVVDCLSTFPDYKPGRVWSYNWAFFAINDYGFPVRPFNGSFHVCAPDPDDVERAFITKIDFDGSGFRPAAFNVAFNSFGSQNSGNVPVDRRSRQATNSTQSEYSIFLNDPIDLCETALSGEITLLGIGRCNDSEYCIKFTTTKEGQVELLLDFDGADNVYSPGTADVQISQNVSAADVGVPTCLTWNGLDGLGNPVPENVSSTIPITIAFAQGIYHFPIYDAEIMSDGFTITSVRPSGPTPLLYYDDSEIDAPSGSSEPDVQLSGCALPCHRWTNYTTGTTVGFGNLNTINSWWFSQLLIEQELLVLPGYYVCSIEGLDTICDNALDTLMLNLEVFPTGITNPVIVSQTWIGPGIVGSNSGDEIVINQGGIYDVIVDWTNNLGDLCTTSCSKSVIQSKACCEVTLACQSDTISYPCNENSPPPPASPEELIDAGLLQVGDAECALLALRIDDMTSNTDCFSQPKITSYFYTIWNDENGNAIIDGEETFVSCAVHYTTSDLTPPTMEFTGDLEGLDSGDTLYIECQATDSNWSIPMPSLNDISVNDLCSDVVVSMTDEITDGDCATDGYMKLYRCSWSATDDCGNISELIIYMALVDHTAPVITNVAADITITCSDEMPQPASEAMDACECAHIDLTVDTMYFNCPTDYQLRRTYRWSDHCGNDTSAAQLVTISNDNELEISLPSGYLDGQEIEVNCEGGTFPFWVARLDTTSISVISSCSDFEVDYEMELVESNDCSAGFLSLYRLQWKVEDACGNVSLATIFIRVADRIAPAILNYPQVKCDGTFDPSELIAQDNCGIRDIQYSQDTLSLSCDNSLLIKHIWTIRDYCGNSITSQVAVHEGDITPPSIILAPPYSGLTSGDAITVDCKFGITPFLVREAVIVSDGCKISSVDIQYKTVQPLDCIAGHLGIYQVTYLASDDCGNQTSFILYITVEAPNLTNFISDDIISLSCNDSPPRVEINGCIDQIEQTGESSRQTCSGVLSFQSYELTSVCGVQFQDTLWLQWIDDEAPIFSELPNTICSTENIPHPLAWDVCQDEYVAVTIEETIMDHCGLPLRVLQYNARDACGNEARHETTIIPTNLELNFNVSYQDKQIIPTGIIPVIIEADCAFEFDPSALAVTPTCPLVGFEYDVQIDTLDCDPYAKSVMFTIRLISGCNVLGEGYFLVNLLDIHPPIFLEQPLDITISCNDTVTFPDLATWDNCTTVLVTKDEIVLPGLPGVIRYLQRWNASDACGNMTSHERLVSKYDEPTCEIVAPDTVQCYSLQRLQALVVGGVEPFQYEWIVNQGNCQVLTKEASMNYMDVVFYEGNVDVTLIVTDAFGCSSICTYVISCTEKPTVDPFDKILHQNTISFDFKLYPNPASNQLFIQSQEDLKFIRIMDLSGNEKMRYNEMTLHIGIDVSALSDGMYLLEIVSSSGLIEVTKVVIVR